MNLLGAGVGLAQTGINALINKGKARRQHTRQKELMDIQHKNQQQLNEQGFDLSKRMWEETNYDAQMGQLDKAGLNPALIYGKGGAGGTTQAGSGGSASGGQAPMEIANPIDLANVALMGAQKEKIEAETRNLEAKSDTEDELRWLRKALLSSQGRLSLAQEKQAMANAGKVNEEAKKLNYQNNAIAKNRELFEKSQWAKMNKEIIEKEAKKININLDKGKIKQIENKIWQDWVNAGSGLLASSSFVLKGLKSLNKEE